LWAKQFSTTKTEQSGIPELSRAPDLLFADFGKCGNLRGESVISIRQAALQFWLPNPPGVLTA
jgi:hypothetical protein